MISVPSPENADPALICVFDDNPVTLRTTSRLLASAGWRVEPFLDRDAIINYAATHQPAAAFINLGGSHSHGLEIAAQLRALSPVLSVIMALKVHYGQAHKMLRIQTEDESVQESGRTSAERRSSFSQIKETAVDVKPNRQDLTICLLDDDPSVLKATGRLLSSMGWAIESFTDPIAFLSYAKTHQAKIVVLDIRMPVMDGLEVQRQLRNISPSTHVIILTSNENPAVRRQAMEAGASAFFLKPMDDDEFLAAIESTANRTDPN